MDFYEQLEKIENELQKLEDKKKELISRKKNVLKKIEEEKEKKQAEKNAALMEFLRQQIGEIDEKNVAIFKQAISSHAAQIKREMGSEAQNVI